MQKRTHYRDDCRIYKFRKNFDLENDKRDYKSKYVAYTPTMGASKELSAYF